MAVSEGCVAGTDSDFNGDGIADVAIADPDATVSGFAGAGRVHVVYGGGVAAQTVSQADAFVDGDPEAGDRFGFALASYDANGDGCDDLAVSSPYEALGATAEAGNVQVLLGSPTGFGPSGIVYYSQEQADMPGGGETEDRFGYSLAAGLTVSAVPFLVIGVPGEDLDDSSAVAQEDAGAFIYLRGATKLMIHQDSAGVPGVVEHHDQYGFAVAATTRHVAASGPGEAVGSAGFAGAVAVFTHTVSADSLTVVGAVDQDLPGQSGVAEPGDWFGRSLSMVDYIPSGGTAADATSMLAVGSPGERLNANTQPTAGRVVTIDSAGQLTELLDLHQGVDGVEDDTEPGDYFGWVCELVNRTPGQPATWENLLLGVGVPGEDSATDSDSGGVQVFSMVGPAGDHDVWAQNAGMSTAGWTAKQGATLGRQVSASATHLYVADPFGDTPAVYAIPWANLTQGATEPVTVHKPGAGGLPSGGVGTFGAAIA